MVNGKNQLTLTKESEKEANFHHTYFIYINKIVKEWKQEINNGIQLNNSKKVTNYIICG